MSPYSNVMVVNQSHNELFIKFNFFNLYVFVLIFDSNFTIQTGSKQKTNVIFLKINLFEKFIDLEKVLNNQTKCLNSLCDYKSNIKINIQLFHLGF